MLNRSLVSKFLWFSALFIFVFVLSFKLQAQPTPPGGGGPGGTNGVPFSLIPPAYSVPGLKITIPVIEGTNVSLSLLEADPAAQYTIIFASNLTSSVWTSIHEGLTGETQFTISLPSVDGGFFRVVRSDDSVTNAAGIGYLFSEYSNTNVIHPIFQGGPAVAMAYLINSTNFENAVWLSYNASPTVHLGTNDGDYDVWFGVQGLDGIQYWTMQTVTLDTIPPVIVVTNPVLNATSCSIIQIQGYSTEPLSGITYDIVNEAGTLTNQQGFVTAQFHDTNSFKFTTNFFQCFDVELANGTNAITLSVADRAGNTTVTNLSFVLDLIGDTNSPIVNLHWPLDGDKLSGTNFTVRGVLDDPSAQIFAQVTDSNGETNAVVEGLVERDGFFWIEELPLSGGTNQVLIVSTDAAGNSVTTNFIVIKSEVDLAINEISDTDIVLTEVPTVTGTVSDSTQAVWVNGVQAMVQPDGTWSAENVPLNEGGTAIVEVRAIPGENGNVPLAMRPSSNDTGNPSSPDASTVAYEKEKPAEVLLTEYQWNVTIAALDGHDHGYNVGIWSIDKPGNQTSDGCEKILNGTAWWHQVTELHWDEHEMGQGRLGSAVGDCLDVEWGPWSEVNKTGPTTGVHQTIANISQISSDATINRRAKGKTELRTGGKGVKKRRNLFTISGEANQVKNAFYPEYDPNESFESIAPEKCQILGKNLGSDGILHIVLPDNANLDATLIAPASYYAYIVGATKHRLVILANDNAIETDVTNAHFCVGQKITFSPGWIPSAPSIQDKVTKWTFEGNYVNYSYQLLESGSGNPYGSVNWTNNPALLTEETTSAWWVSGNAAYKAKLGQNLTFANGQQAVVTSDGIFDMFRPKAVMFETAVRGTPSNVWITPWNSVHFGEIGLGQQGGPNNMSFKVQVLSPKFAGNAKITQLCSIDATSVLGVNVSGVLDNEDPYVDNIVLTDSTNPFNGLPNNILWLDDAPRNGWISSFHLNGSFVDYIMFMPALPDSIYVPIAKVTWATSFGATYPSTAISPNSVTGPSGPTDSEDWPVWTDVFNNPND